MCCQIIVWLISVYRIYIVKMKKIYFDHDQARNNTTQDMLVIPHARIGGGPSDYTI